MGMTELSRLIYGLIAPRPQCKNGNPNCHHQPAPRGSKTGTQGRKGSYERSIIPEELCLEVLNSVCGVGLKKINN